MSKKVDTNKFKEIEELLKKLDVDSDKYKKNIFNDLKYKIENKQIYNNMEKDDIYMKNKFFKPSRIAIAMSTTLVLGTTFIYGDEILSSIIKVLKVGNTEIVQYDNFNEQNSNYSNDGLYLENDALSLEDMQEGFKGKLFDKNGNEILYGEHNEYYSVDGKLITEMMVKDLPNGKHEFVVGTESIDNKINSLSEVKKIANTNIKFANYIPKEYKFKEAISSSEGNNINLTYENESGETIVIIASSEKEVSLYIATTEDFKEIYIDDIKVLISKQSAVWEIDNVDYQLYWNLDDVNEQMNIDEVSKIIKSFM